MCTLACLLFLFSLYQQYYFLSLSAVFIKSCKTLLSLGVFHLFFFFHNRSLLLTMLPIKKCALNGESQQPVWIKNAQNRLPNILGRPVKILGWTGRVQYMCAKHTQSLYFHAVPERLCFVWFHVVPSSPARLLNIYLFTFNFGSDEMRNLNLPNKFPPSLWMCPGLMCFPLIIRHLLRQLSFALRLG